MRRPTGYAHLTRLKTFLAHSGQTAVLAAVAVMAMAAAPSATRSSVAAEAPAALAAPVAPPIKATVEKPGPITRTIAFSAPVRGRPINSPFGLRKLAIEAKARAHKGVDIAAPIGTSVFSTSEGRVLRTGYDAGGYGKFIEVRHPNGLTSLYGHLSRVDVTAGAVIAAGERIGLVGSTGFSTGPHLHFEVRRGGAQVDPAKIMGRDFQVAAKG
ncbi:M23 family metallopeptidase [Brevundimonas sp. PAMC22021]|uniref:M23 family metallopeptidase n=1 Tax=Brevundimonas sp. PAMC22021 TaxID=2861285 RepID=UPI001C6313C4|nr:M23 family metallopeptidase [Brevundimonas sp. PAMC22021]QYF87596.1 M23 family metallopeptidase [Brevundimonas sp. PAMC22021]